MVESVGHAMDMSAYATLAVLGMVNPGGAVAWAHGRTDGAGGNALPTPAGNTDRDLLVRETSRLRAR